MTNKTLAQTQKIMDVLAHHNVGPVTLAAWVNGLKNVIINTAVNLPECDKKTELKILKQDMQESKAVADFLEDLRVVMED